MSPLVRSPYAPARIEKVSPTGKNQPFHGSSLSLPPCCMPLTYPEWPIPGDLGTISVGSPAPCSVPFLPPLSRFATRGPVVCTVPLGLTRPNPSPIRIHGGFQLGLPKLVGLLHVSLLSGNIPAISAPHHPPYCSHIASSITVRPSTCTRTHTIFFFFVTFLSLEKRTFQWLGLALISKLLWAVRRGGLPATSWDGKEKNDI